MNKPDESAGIPLHEEQRRHIAALEREIRHVQREIAAHRHDIGSPLQILQGMVDIFPRINEKLEGAPLRAIEQIRDMVEHLLRDLRKNITCSAFVDLLREVSQTAMQRTKPLHSSVTLGFNTYEAEQCYILASKVHWKNILQNLFENAFRKGAQNVSVDIGWGKISESRQKAIEIRIRDDGEGMLPAILEHLRSGSGITDKTEGDGLEPGKEHGVGLKSVRMFVEKLYGGEMSIDSVHVTADPDNHGTTFTFKIPVYSCDEEGRTVPVTLPPGETENHPPCAETVAADAVEPVSRRRAIRWIAGGTAAAAASVAGIWNVTRAAPTLRGAENVRLLLPEFPLTDVETDGRGRIRRFTLDTNEEPIVYDADDGRSAASFTRFDIDGETSVLSFGQVTTDDRMRRMFLSSSKEGLFGLVRIAAGGESRAAYVCAPAGASLAAVPRERLYPLEDAALLLRQYLATNADMLMSRELQTMIAALRRLAVAPDPAVRDERQQRGQIALAAQSLLRIHALSAGKTVKVTMQRELFQASDRFLLIDRNVADPVTQREWNDVLRSRNTPCFLATHADEAARIVRGERNVTA